MGDLVDRLYGPGKTQASDLAGRLYGPGAGRPGLRLLLWLEKTLSAWDLGPTRSSNR